MASEILIVTNTTWTMVRDATVSGDFVGVISAMTSPIFVRVGSIPPLAGDGGFKLETSSQISLSKSAGDKLYVRSAVGNAALQIDTNLSANMLPVGLFNGFRAMTIQTYTEANVKNGAQFEFSSPRTTLAASGVATSVLQTGSKRVLVKSRVIQFTGKGITAKLYEGGTFTAGSGTPLPIYNMRRKTPIPAALSTTRSGVTVTALGTEYGAPTVGIGSTALGQAVYGAFQVQGIERWLEPNSTYFLQITNDSTTDPTDISTYVTFYEGEPDIGL